MILAGAGCSRKSPDTAPSSSKPASRATAVVPATRPAAKDILPADVAAFVADRDACDHFRGEEPYDGKRAEFLVEATQRYCTGTDRRLTDLRRRYAGNRAAMDRLRGYEDGIE